MTYFIVLKINVFFKFRSYLNYQNTTNPKINSQCEINDWIIPTAKIRENSSARKAAESNRKSISLAGSRFALAFRARATARGPESFGFLATPSRTIIFAECVRGSRTSTLCASIVSASLRMARFQTTLILGNA